MTKYDQSSSFQSVCLRSVRNRGNLGIRITGSPISGLIEKRAQRVLECAVVMAFFIACVEEKCLKSDVHDPKVFWKYILLLLRG